MDLKSSASKGFLRRLKIVVCFALLGIACVNCLRKVSLSRVIVSDYAAYWTASKLILAGENPYDPVKVFKLESEMPKPPRVVLVMRNPPWAFPLVLPLGLLDFKTSRILWTIPQIVILIGCGSWFWKQHVGSPDSRWVAALITTTMIPSLWVLVMGQITPLILLGVIGFLFYESTDRSNSWMQAACLSLIALKPQLLYLFWIALLLTACWALRSLDSTTIELRRWRLFSRTGVLLFVCSAIALFFDPHVFSQYSAYLRNTPILLEAIPTPGNFLRIHTNLRWTQFVPMVAGTLWLFWHWRRKRDEWNWAEQMPLLLIVSLATTTYSWFYDQVLLLPVILYAAAHNFPARNWKHTAAVVALYLAVDLGIAILFYKSQRLDDFRMLWTMPAWCLLYGGLLWMGRTQTDSVHKQLPAGNVEEPEPVANYAANLVG